MAQGFNTSGLKVPFGIFSHAAWAPAGRTLYISGQVSQDAEGKVLGEGDIAAQTEQILRNIGTILIASAAASTTSRRSRSSSRT
jgi:enamine deaminase RidA (YjgF/YER057c/UK114 family)